VALGFHPFARQSDLDWVPKSRYPVMQRYFPSKGTRGIDMMRRTATVQANFDFTSERDAMRKLRVALAAGPIATALFAASPFVEGVRTAFKSYRAHVWLDVDNDRAGLLPFAWRPDATLGDYVRWALNVPMFIIKRGSSVIDATQYTFGRFLHGGIEGHRATRSDWESHLKTLFPDARLQRTLEVRGADSVPARLSMALPALWIGLLYDEEGLRFVEDRLCTFGHDAWAAVRAMIPTQGLSATIGHTTVGALARELVAVASRALARRGVTDAQGRDETQFLAPLEACVVDRRSLGDLVLHDGNDADPDALMARAAY
jgi:glutamate--cysteine ligase